MDGCYCQAADLSDGCWAGTMRWLRFPWTDTFCGFCGSYGIPQNDELLPFPETDRLIKFISPFKIAKWIAFARDELQRVVGKVNGREGGLLGTDTSSREVPASAGVQFESHNLLPMHYSPANGFDSVGI